RRVHDQSGRVVADVRLCRKLVHERDFGNAVFAIVLARVALGVEGDDEGAADAATAASAGDEDATVASDRDLLDAHEVGQRKVEIAQSAEAEALVIAAIRIQLGDEPALIVEGIARGTRD